MFSHVFIGVIAPSIYSFSRHEVFFFSVKSTLSHWQVLRALCGFFGCCHKTYVTH